MTINVTRNAGWPGGPWLWASVGPMPPSREGEKGPAEASHASLLAVKIEGLLRGPFLADVGRLGYKRAIERLEVAVAAIRALSPTALAIVDRGAAR